MVRMIKQPLRLSFTLAWYLLTDCPYNAHVCPPLLMVAVLSWWQEEEATASKAVYRLQNSLYAVLLASDIFCFYTPTK